MEADLPELGSPQGWIEPALEQIAVALRIPLAVRENEIMVAFGTLESPNSKGVKEPGGKLTVRRESFDFGTRIARWCTDAARERLVSSSRCPPTEDQAVPLPVVLS